MQGNKIYLVRILVTIIISPVKKGTKHLPIFSLLADLQN